MKSTLAPTGTLRAAINFGNSVLAQRGPGGEAQGVSAVLAAELARRLGVPLATVPFESAGAVTAAAAQDVFDIAFLAIDPVRGQGLDFTAPYVLIEGGYAVRSASPIQAVDQVDTPGTTIEAQAGSAYDLFLTRTLQQATLNRVPAGKDGPGVFLAGRNQVLAGVIAMLAPAVQANPALRMLPGRFMAIEQAMAVVKGRDPAGHAYLQTFIAEMKSSGLVARALADTGQRDAKVAP